MTQTRLNPGEEALKDAGAWKAFHQAYDSALRAYRRGPDVARAVNWLYVSSRENATREERESERGYRELGLKAAQTAKSEFDLAPLVWRAMTAGAGGQEPGEPTPPKPETPDTGGGETPPEKPGPINPEWEFIL